MTKKLPKKKKSWKRAIAIGATTLIASGAFWWIGVKNHHFPVPSYQALRVIDGDTFETTEKQIIRLADVGAPEISNCGGPEAKKALEKLVLKKNLYIKVIYRNGFRLISHVYNEGGFVNESLIKTGAAYYQASGKTVPELANASSYAQDHHLGVYGPTCLQETNTKNPNCVIKGNLRDRPVIKTYHFPGCGQYNHTLVELSRGDRWFCTEKEALAAGFKKGTDCFTKSWPDPK